MAIPFGNSIDLGKNELLNARLQNLSAAPANPLDGLFYYDATTKTAPADPVAGDFWNKIL